MRIKVVLLAAVAFATGSMAFAAASSAQTSKVFRVSDIEAGPSGPPAAGVSAAHCGTSVVVGFGDTKSGVNSFDGYAVSSNGGRTFQDLGVLPVSTEDTFGFGPDELGSGASSMNPTGILNPSLACGDANHFYYASLFQSDSIPCIGFPICSAISISTSTDGGKSWSLPVVVDAASGDTHILLSPSIAVDPIDPQRLYVAYLFWNSNNPFDTGGSNCAKTAFLNGIMAIKVASSADGGSTWTQIIVEDSCDDAMFGTPQLVAPTIAVSAMGQVNVAYEFLPSQVAPGPTLPNEIHFARSTDHGQTFSPPMKVSTDAAGNALPELAVDRTSSKHRGTIYLTWSGSPSGTSTEVLVSESLDEGASFSFPRVIDPRNAGSGDFQTNPVIAVDKDGQIEACFYDTTNSPTSSSVYSYNCATSFNHAATWRARLVASGVPVGFDALTNDSLLQNDGFFTAFELSSSGTRSVVGEKSDDH